MFKCFTQVFIFFNLCALLHFIFLKGLPRHQYKRPGRTCWVEHQETALKASNKNLPILIGFCNHQILSPHNTTVQIVPKLKGYLSNVAKTELVIFDSAKQDLLSILCPLTKVLQDCSLVALALITTYSSTLRTILKLKN